MYSSIVLLMLFVCIVLYYVRGKYFNYGFLHAIILRVSSKIYNIVHSIRFFCSHEIQIILPGLFIIHIRLHNCKPQFLCRCQQFRQNMFLKYAAIFKKKSSYDCLKNNYCFNCFTTCFH